MPLGEFELIDRYFRRAPQRKDVVLGVGDDAALLQVPPDRLLVATTDTLVEGRHFLADAPPDSVGHQALAVNLSDLAAMGAEPAWALLSLSVPEIDEAWIAPFVDGMHALAQRCGLEIVGGDTARGPRVITIAALGLVERGGFLTRSGARPGDHLYVSGWPGEASAGLELLLADRGARPDDPLVRRHRYPEPQLELGRALRGRATSAMDVSDGLLGDLAKLCAASNVGARVELESLPVSPALARHCGRAEQERHVLAGGDDYELLFTLPADAPPELYTALGAICPITRIGGIESRPGISCTRNGVTVDVEARGYDHFK